MIQDQGVTGNRDGNGGRGEEKREKLGRCGAGSTFEKGYWGGLIKYTVLIKYTGVIKYTVRKPILSVEICEIKYTVFVYIFLTKKIFQQVLHKKSKKNACISFYTIGADGVQICENLSHQKIVHFSTLTPPLAGIGPKMPMVVFSRGFGY